jgi:NDP-sugar pyrophosphorylase family protein
MQAVILLGGLGTRLKSVLGDIPKALVPLSGRPLLEYLFTLLSRQKIRDVVLCTGVGAGQIEQWAGDGGRFGLKIRYSPETAPLGTAGALRNIPFPLHDEFLVLYGDVLVQMDLGKFIGYHRRKGGTATLVVHPSSHPHDSDLVIMDDDGRITGFPGRPKPGEPFINLTNAALYLMKSASLDHIPPGKNLDLGRHIFPDMLAAGEPLFGYNTDEYLKDVGTPERLEQAEKDMIQGRFPALPRDP